MILCRMCGVEKSEDAFSLRSPGKKHKWCKSCFSVYHKSYREKNTQRLSKYWLEWFHANKQKAKEIQNKYIKSEGGRKKRLESTLRRQQRVKTATPVWADLEAIKQIYENCPEGYSVDHIVPIYSQIVCGLHVHYNLQYLTAVENVKKGTKLLEEVK